MTLSMYLIDWLAAWVFMETNCVGPPGLGQLFD